MPSHLKDKQAQLISNYKLKSYHTINYNTVIISLSEYNLKTYNPFYKHTKKYEFVMQIGKKLSK